MSAFYNYDVELENMSAFCNYDVEFENMSAFYNYDVDLENMSAFFCLFSKGPGSSELVLPCVTQYRL